MPIPLSTEREILSVSQLNRASKDLLETYLPLLWVEGELSNVATPSSGHWYFTLKDARAQVRCAMFKNRNQLVRFRPNAGQQIVVRARVSLYEGRGEYQLLIEHMEPAGFGDLQRQFELLKDKLQNEGLFAQEHKRPLPEWPKRLGIVTSPTGAALQDVLQVLQRRFPALPVLVLPVAVQGAGAAKQIAAAIRRANAESLCDVLIVGRGGGSLEDLWAFNEEVVARAIYASEIPVVSAVGHEIDFTIADFTADLRAPTPSAAAELVSPSQQEVAQRLDQLQRALVRHMQQRLRWLNQRVQHSRARLQHPGQTLLAQSQRLDQLELRLQRAWKRRLEKAGENLAKHQQRLHQCNPGRQLQRHQQSCAQLSRRLYQAMSQQLNRQQTRLQQVGQLLHSVSPLNTLQRGYAIVLNQQGQALREAQQTQPGAQVEAKLHKGSLICKIERIQHHDS